MTTHTSCALTLSTGPYRPEQEQLNEPQMHHFFVSFWQRWWKNSYQRRAHDVVIQLSSSWSCSRDSVGGLNRSDLSLRARCFPLQWGGLKVSHSTAHPARGGPRHLSTGRLHRQAPGSEHLLEHREKEMDLYNWRSWFYFSASHWSLFNILESFFLTKLKILFIKSLILVAALYLCAD